MDKSRILTLQATVAARKARHAAIREANAALLPATLEGLAATAGGQC